MSALMVLGELRAVGAFVTHVVGLHRALPFIAALRAVGRVLRRVILSEMKAVRPSAPQLHGAPKSTARLKVKRKIMIVFRRTKFVLI